ncbi:hypothetical protein CBFG_01603 [Clostridiales bacterium 1_7_47FAA]|nr:hypothetical protein CBFG_01603 [Clostridiales bacterium 1_7_47FAA]
MFKKEYTIDELMKAENDMQNFVADKFLQYVSDDENRRFLAKEYKTLNPNRIKYLVEDAAEFAGCGMTQGEVDTDAFQHIFDGIKFSIEDILGYIDDPQEFKNYFNIELYPHILNFENLNENSVRAFAEREYVKQIMKKYKEIPGYDFKTAMEDMTKLMKAA